MGELIQILGTDEMPHKPTELEKLAEEIAQNHLLDFKMKENGMNEWGWEYYYGRFSESRKYKVYYDFHVFTGIEGGPVIPFEKAKQIFIGNMESKKYQETLFFHRGDRISFSVMYDSKLNLADGKYAVNFSNKHAVLSMPQIRVLFKEAITCEFLKRSRNK